MHAHDTGKYRSRPAGVGADRLALYGATAASYLEDITDEELTAVARLPGLGGEWTVQAVVETSSSATPATTRRGSKPVSHPQGSAQYPRCRTVSSLGGYFAEGSAGSDQRKLDRLRKPTLPLIGQQHSEQLAVLTIHLAVAFELEGLGHVLQAMALPLGQHARW